MTQFVISFNMFFIFLILGGVTGYEIGFFFGKEPDAIEFLKSGCVVGAIFGVIGAIVFNPDAGELAEKINRILMMFGVFFVIVIPLVSAVTWLFFDVIDSGMNLFFVIIATALNAFFINNIRKEMVKIGA